uniref:Glucagon like peptide 2 receptor n=1 Tax=Neolamprologus brichardi TaxID=32507 RepID=A0A3Q4H1Q2_NEOBR
PGIPDCASLQFAAVARTSSHGFTSVWTLNYVIHSSSFIVTGSLLESLIAKRNEYSKNCNKTLVARNYCKGAFDMFVCWPHSSPGNVSVPCPSFLPWISDGNSQDYCLMVIINSWNTVLKLTFFMFLINGFFKLLLYLLTRKLHCTRNYIHMNLFVSFILRAAAILSKEIIMHIMYSNLPKDDPGWNTYSMIMCRLSKVCMEYFVACNYFWLLVEAIFLHTLLFTAVLTKRCLLKKYMLLGWGELVNPLFLRCWSIINRGFWWIIKGPITLSVLVIFFIFIKILMLLLSKLKADQVKFTDYRYSLARATLVLIPLLGIHEVVFTVLIDECVDGSSRYARNFVNLTLSSFQGFLVAVLYCFANGEVQAELKKRWQLFLFTNHFKVRTCFRGVPLKHLWKCTRGHHPRCSRQSESYDEGGISTMHPHLLQVAVHGRGRVLGKGEVKGQALNGYDVTGLEFLTRKSLSSSDGEMTLGETMEEILEESEF